MREIHRIIKLKQYNDRITPAYAGNTHINLIGDKAVEDHPRVCGKYSAGIAKAVKT